jgi:hypothetical protein
MDRLMHLSRVARLTRADDELAAPLRKLTITD